MTLKCIKRFWGFHVETIFGPILTRINEILDPPPPLACVIGGSFHVFPPSVPGICSPNWLQMAGERCKCYQ